MTAGEQDTPPQDDAHPHQNNTTSHGLPIMTTASPHPRAQGVEAPRRYLPERPNQPETTEGTWDRSRRRGKRAGLRIVQGPNKAGAPVRRLTEGTNGRHGGRPTASGAPAAHGTGWACPALSLACTFGSRIDVQEIHHEQYHTAHDVEQDPQRNTAGATDRPYL
nr:hypothetical protein Iba_chr02cCG3920 [Ipomoea batatas]